MGEGALIASSDASDSTQVFSSEGRERAIKNIADHMKTSRHPESIKQMLGIFSYVSTELSDGIAKRLDVKDYPKDLSKVSFLGSHNQLDLKNPVKAAKCVRLAFYNIV